MKIIRILLAGDPALIRRSLRPPLESECGWHICAEAASGREAVKMAERFHPEIAVLDAALPDIDGVEAARQIKAARPQTEVLILTDDESEELTQRILAADARGHLSRSDAAEKIIPAIEALCVHRQYLASSAARVAFENHLKRQAEQEHAKLRHALRARTPLTQAQPSPPSKTQRR